MIEQLKPCPFCRGQPNEPKKEGGSDERNGYNFVMSISCRGCGAAVKAWSHQMETGWCDDKGEALAKWGRRTAQNGDA